MTKQIGRFVRRAFLLFAGLHLLASMGCATRPEAEEAIPRHPFPRWVSQLETGETHIDDVHVVFGEPSEIKEQHRGGTIWRYAYPEIRWSRDDPRRPEVAADGTPRPYEPSFRQKATEGLQRAALFMNRLVYYPPARKRDRPGRLRPATVHQLELEFATDGTLTRYHYIPRESSARPRPRG